MPLGSAETVALTGMMGSGKSTVSFHLARLLKRRRFSLDLAIERAAGKPIAAIFAEDGERSFRSMERILAATIPAGVVADLGGGAFCDPSTALRLLAVSRVVFLDVSLKEALERMKESASRPLAASWEGLLARRLPLYRRAHLTVRVDGLAPEAIARKIAEAL